VSWIHGCMGGIYIGDQPVRVEDLGVSRVVTDM
jgi:hypothetical protein